MADNQGAVGVLGNRAQRAEKPAIADRHLLAHTDFAVTFCGVYLGSPWALHDLLRMNGLRIRPGVGVQRSQGVGL